MGNANMTRMAVEEYYAPFNRERDSKFRVNSPVSFNGTLGKYESGSNHGGSSTSCSSSAGCCSRSITEEEDGDDESLDDREAVADALAANENRKTPPFDPSPKEEPICKSQSCGVITMCLKDQRAWIRQWVQSLLRQILEHGDLMMLFGRRVCLIGRSNTTVPIQSGVIAMEKSPGFARRILEADNRCPGCRRLYEQDPAKAEGSLQGGFGITC